jgi:hypothetical protein
MAVAPIQARCDRCAQDFHLFELLDRRTGRCPRCGRTLTEDWTSTLLEEAARADIAQRHLVAALRSLHQLPGVFSIQPYSVLRNLFEEAGWDHERMKDPDWVREELPRLRALLAGWEPPEPAPARPWYRRLWDVITGRPPATGGRTAHASAAPDEAQGGSSGPPPASPSLSTRAAGVGSRVPGVQGIAVDAVAVDGASDDVRAHRPTPGQPVQRRHDDMGGVDLEVPA